MPSAFAPKIPKSTPFMVRSFMGGGIFYNMSAKKRNVENKWLYILSTFQKTFIKKKSLLNSFTLLLEVDLQERSTNMFFV